MTPFAVQVIVGIIAFCSLALGVYNFVHAKGEPVRARQRELQDELRALTEQVLRHSGEAYSSVERGRDIEGDEVPDCIDGADKEFDRYAKRLSDPDLMVKAKLLGLHMFEVSIRWDDVLKDRKPRFNGEVDQKRVAADEARLMKAIDKVTPDLKAIIKKLDDIDRGRPSLI